MLILMEIRSIGESLLKSSAQSLHCFLAPSLYKVRRPRSIAIVSNQKHARNHRHLSTSKRPQADRSSPTPTPEKPNKENKARAGLQQIFDYSRNQQAPSATSSSMPGRSYMNPKINSKLNELFPNQNDPPPSSSTAVKEVAEAFKSFSDQNRGGLMPGGISGRMLNPDSRDGSTIGQGQMNPGRDAFPGQPRMLTKRTIRSRPTVGRTIEVEEKKGVDLGRAITKLEQLLRANSVKYELNRQKYHERPGLKRKRLKSERWRQHFKAGFQATVRRAMQMRRQGW